MLFTDESVFRLSRADGQTRVWRSKNERFADCNIIERGPYCGGSVMVWAGISNNYKTHLVIINGTLTGQRYIDQVINPYIVPFFRGNRTTYTLMDDNTCPHRAIIVRNRLQQAGIQTMDWPSRSLDLHPIEHAWNELGSEQPSQSPNHHRTAWTSVDHGVEWYTIIRHSEACNKYGTSLPGSF